MNKVDKIINEIKKLNPFLLAEQRDAYRSRDYCKDKLIQSYSDYIDSEKRVSKIESRIKSLNGD